MSSSSAATSPDTTTAERPLTAAMLIRLPKGANNSRARSVPHAIDTMPPGPASDGQQLAAQRDHPCGISQGQRTGDVRGGDFTLRMADHGIRADSDRLPQFGQRHHHREEHRLHHVHAIQARSTRHAAQDIGQRPVDEFCEGVRARVDLSGEYRCGIEQFDTHAQPLGALAGEDEYRLARRASRCPESPSTAVIAGQLVQPGQQPIPISRRPRRPDAQSSNAPPATTPHRRHQAPGCARTCSANRAA